MGGATILAAILTIGGTASSAPPAPATFHGLTPARLLDTRPTGVTIDGEGSKGVLGATMTVEVEVVGRGGVPADGVGSVALNVTAINPSASSFITVYPTGGVRPLASNLNLAPGRTLPNMVLVPVGNGGKVSVYNENGQVHVAVDVLGWFPTQHAFNGLVPARLADTRATGQTIDGAGRDTGAIGAGQSQTVTVRGRGGVPDFGVGAVALNVTAINPTAPSFLTVYPAGATRPTASNLNLAPGRTLPNMVIVPLGSDGAITIFNDKGTTHAAVDVLGWFPATSTFTGLSPVRLADTRSSGQTVDGNGRAGGAVAAGGVLRVSTLGRGGIPPSGVGAVALNVTAISPTAASFLTVYPTGESRPTASNLNLAAGRTLPNMVIVPVGAGGQIDIYNDKGASHVAVDVLGWFPSLTVAPSTRRVHLSSAGVQANGHVGNGVISGNGRFVAFESYASNLVPLDTNGTADIFVRDLLTGVTERVSVSSSGAQSNGYSEVPTISDDGRFVAYTSEASNLVPGDTNDTNDIFVRDRHLGTTTRVSVSTAGVQGNDGSYAPALSGDGRFVAFGSQADNLVAGDTNGAVDVFVRELASGVTTRVSMAHDGAQANADANRIDISRDGRFVVFDSHATNLVGNDTNGKMDVFVRDRTLGITTRVSVTSAGVEGNHESELPVISGNGRIVAFQSQASNLVANDTNNMIDVFVHDRITGTTDRVSVSHDGSQSATTSYGGGISDDGRYVVFSNLSALVPGDTNDTTDAFVRDRTANTTERVSVASNGAGGNAGVSLPPRLSGDGRYVVFSSMASNLVPGDTNGKNDLFVRDRGTG